jgi:hypothetical protein
MKTTPKRGDFIKAVGADWGAWFDGKKWHTFACFGCLVATHPIRDRLQNGDYPALSKNFATGKLAEIKHDPETHNRWFLAGKPVTRP